MPINNQNIRQNPKYPFRFHAIMNLPEPDSRYVSYKSFAPAQLILWLCISLSLRTQCLRRLSGILQKTMALFSSESTFSAILSWRSGSSSTKSRKNKSIACSDHTGRVLTLRSVSANTDIQSGSDVLAAAGGAGVLDGALLGGGTGVVATWERSMYPVDMGAVGAGWGATVRRRFSVWPDWALPILLSAGWKRLRLCCDGSSGGVSAKDDPIEVRVVMALGTGRL